MVRGSRLSLRAMLLIAAALVCAGSAGVLIAALKGMSSAALFLGQTHHSYEQLVLVSQLEADILVLLLDEQQASARGKSAPARLQQEQDFEKTLAIYIASIRSDLESRRRGGAADAAGDELEQGLAMRDMFRGLLAELGSGASGREVSGDTRAAAFHQRTADLRARVRRIVEGERSEVAQAIEAMATMRQGFARLAFLVAAAAIGGLAVMLAFLNRSLIAPIAALGHGAQRIGIGNLDARVEPRGARDVAELGQQFNLMAERLADQQSQLQASNETLERTVRERTRQLEAKSEQLAGIDRSRRLFFSKVSHELRTPVTVLRGEAEVALRSNRADLANLREALGHIVANSDILERRLADLLALARAEDGRVALEKRTVDLSVCLREARDLAQAYARSSGVDMVVEGSASNLQVVGDASWLRQAMLAIVDNAVKHSPPGGKVALRARSSGASVEIEISDEGEGAAAEALYRLFEPYFQTEDGARRGGSGLGLAVARWVTEQHGGSIGARNLEDGGFAVTMTLPFEAA